MGTLSSKPSAVLVPEVVDDRVPINVRKLIDLAKALATIDSAEKRKEAGDLHARFGAERRATEEQKENDALLKQATKRLAELREPYTLAIATLSQWETYVANRLAAYDREQIRISREQQQKALAQTAKKNDTIIAQANKTGAQPLLQATKIVATPPKTVHTEDGLSSSRKTVYVARIEGVGPDEDLRKLIGSDPRFDKLSREYFVVNMAAIQKDAKEPRHHARLKAMGILIEETFDYTSRG